MIKTVIFDIDNTLYDYDTCHAIGYEALADCACGLYGLSRVDFDRLYPESMAVIKERVGDRAPIHSRALRLQVFQELIGVHNYTQVVQLYRAYWEPFFAEIKPFPDVIRYLQLLKQRGIRTGVGTDMTALMQIRKLSVLGMDDLIDFVVTSEEAGAEKPGEAFFKLCCAKALAPAKDCLFIGDNMRKDVNGALACGMNAVHFYRPDAVPIPNSDAEFEVPEGQKFVRVSSYEELIVMAGGNRGTVPRSTGESVLD